MGVCGTISGAICQVIDASSDFELFKTLQAKPPETRLTLSTQRALRKYFHNLIVSNLKNKIPSSRGVMLAYAYVSNKHYNTVESRIREQKKCFQPFGLKTFHQTLATQVATALHNAITEIGFDSPIVNMNWEYECRKLILGWIYPDTSWGTSCKTYLIRDHANRF